MNNMDHFESDKLFAWIMTVLVTGTIIFVLFGL